MNVFSDRSSKLPLRSRLGKLMDDFSFSNDWQAKFGFSPREKDLIPCAVGFGPVAGVVLRSLILARSASRSSIPPLSLCTRGRAQGLCCPPRNPWGGLVAAAGWRGCIASLDPFGGPSGVCAPVRKFHGCSAGSHRACLAHRFDSVTGASRLFLHSEFASYKFKKLWLFILPLTLSRSRKLRMGRRGSPPLTASIALPRIRRSYVSSHSRSGKGSSATASSLWPQVRFSSPSQPSSQASCSFGFCSIIYRTSKISMQVIHSLSESVTWELRLSRHFLPLLPCTVTTHPASPPPQDPQVQLAPAVPPRSASCLMRPHRSRSCVSHLHGIPSSGRTFLFSPSPHSSFSSSHSFSSSSLSSASGSLSASSANGSRGMPSFPIARGGARSSCTHRAASLRTSPLDALSISSLRHAGASHFPSHGRPLL